MTTPVNDAITPADLRQLADLMDAGAATSPVISFNDVLTVLRQRRIMTAQEATAQSQRDWDLLVKTAVECTGSSAKGLPFSWLLGLPGEGLDDILYLVRRGHIAVRDQPTDDRFWYGLRFTKHGATVAAIIHAARSDQAANSGPVTPARCQVNCPGIIQPHCRGWLQVRACPLARPDEAPPPDRSTQNAVPRSGHPAGHPSTEGTDPPARHQK